MCLPVEPMVGVRWRPGSLTVLICIESLQTAEGNLRRRTSDLASLQASAAGIERGDFLSSKLAAKTITILSNILASEEN